MNRIGKIILGLTLLLGFAGIAQAQSVVSNTASVNLTFNQSETIVVSTDVSSVSFNGAGVASSPINVTTAYNLSSSRTKLSVAAYFSSSSALSGTAGSIPTSQINEVTSGDGSGVCGGTLSWPDGSTLPNACPWIFQTTALSPTNGTRTDTVTLSILNASSVVAGSYSGVINFSAQAL